ncbi:GrBNV gp19-like protein [Tomelloso virus]|uniref:GrBNV gp19-like protein n=1 Tax=Tomelloso virus TaxID=2053981 RepID=A0A2H4T2W9_9VIRU|nr:GrBNV gp19-like protein [Tomelloso virus]ATY70218.1 GrBNV gp19-like protein [Tomelloso virus]
MQYIVQHDKMGLISTLFSILFSILVIALIIWIVVYPEPLKPILSLFYPLVEYEANANATKTGTQTFYTTAGTSNTKLVVIFIGGGGMYSTPSGAYGFANQLNTLLGQDYDILLFSYPVRFKNTILDTMLAINKILKNYLHYTTIHAVGISFGSLLAGAFYQKEMSSTKATAMKVPQIGMQFASLGIFSGLLECTFNAELATTLFNYYIMRDTPSTINYTCYGMSIPKYVVSANSDFLVAQTAKFLQQEQCEYKIYSTKNLPHAFSQYINLPDAIDSIENYSKFVVKVDTAVSMRSAKANVRNLVS